MTSSSMEMPKTFSEAMADLKAEGTDRTARTVTKLPMKDIKTLEVIFQPRDVDHAFLASDQHKKTLAEAIVEAADHTLEPLTVWWSGKCWYVIDGHHRLEAYKLAAKKVTLPALPVVTFEGTLNQAIRESAALNCRDKLPMKKGDKLERAWRLVCLPEKWSKANIHLATGVAERTVGNMRKVRAELLKTCREEDLLDLTWADAKRGEPGEVDDGWEERQAVALQKRLAKTFGTKLADQPQITARALELYSDRLRDDLIETWGAGLGQAEEDEPDF